MPAVVLGKRELVLHFKMLVKQALPRSCKELRLRA